VFAALDRVLVSSGLAPNSRRATFLSHIVGEALAGRPENLTGKALAMDVFGRGADFDPMHDSIVRTEARRVRHMLNAYYAGPGSADPIRISLPKGTYVPRFEQGQAEPPEADTGRPTVPEVLTTTATAAEQPMAPVPARGRSIQFLRSAGANSIATAAAIIAGLVLVSLWWNLRPGNLDSMTRAIPTVLVKPFGSPGENEPATILAEGLTIKLIAGLMKFADIGVYTFGDAVLVAEDDTILERKDIDYIVAGAVRGDAEHLSVAVQLVHRSDNRVLWSEVYSGTLSPRHFSDLEAEIAGRIASVIAQPYGIIPTEVAQRIADAGPEVEMDSFACVMRGYAYRFANRSDLYTRVRECLEDTVVRDPAYAEAWAMLAYLRLDGQRFGYEAAIGDDPTRALAPARVAAARALGLDPDNERALKALSTVEFYAGNYERSFQLARQAVDINPNDPDALGQLGWRLSLRGQFDEGIPYLEQAVARSVKPPPWYFQPMAVDRLMQEDMDGMLAFAEQAATDGSAPSTALLAIAQAGVGDKAAAQANLALMAERWPLLATDPASALAIHQLHPDLIAALVAGLRNAGWQPEGKAD
jgi:TolB-like protein/tetratricopeptide (TPR) repeat protein